MPAAKVETGAGGAGLCTVGTSGAATEMLLIVNKPKISARQLTSASLVRLRRKCDFMVLGLKLKNNCYGGNGIGAKFKRSERVVLPLN